MITNAFSEHFCVMSIKLELSSCPPFIPASMFSVSVVKCKLLNRESHMLVCLGYYLYMDSSVGHWGEAAMMLSEIFTPDSRGHCFTFWYHLYGNNIGTLNLYINNRYRKKNTHKESLCICVFEEHLMRLFSQDHL